MIREVFLFVSILATLWVGCASRQLNSEARKYIPRLIFPVIGDWGTGTAAQDDTALGLANWVNANPETSFIISTGDNFYDGVWSTTDPWFDERWKDVYNQYPSLADKMWYLILGNHDYYEYIFDKEWNQVDRHPIDGQWYMPYLWFKLEFATDAGDLDFFMLDTEAINENMNNRSDQIAWLEEELQNSTAEWKVVFAHHPLYCSGGHAPGAQTSKSFVEPLMEQYGVQLYIAGHDHALEHHIHYYNGNNLNFTDHVTSAGGGRELYSEDPNANDVLLQMNTTTVSYFETFGFINMDFDAGGLHITYADQDGNVFYGFDRTLDSYLPN